ncbi:MAG: hypothetical protein FJY55_00375, partial [Betaproteobacteria bacterium]|nr:hypothetical protein [Betaproteobacteria bacterium]
YGIDDGNYITGMTTIASPILNQSEQVAYAIAILGTSEQVNRIGQPRIGKSLRNIADVIRAKL